MKKDRIELKLRIAGSRTFKIVLLFVIGNLLIFSLFSLFYFGSDILGATPSDTPATTADSQVKWAGWAMVFFPWLFLPLLFVFKRQRVILDGSGIHFKNNSKMLGKSWSVRWKEITSLAWHVIPGQPLSSRLVIQTANAKQRLAPYAWIEEDEALSRLFRLKSPDIQEAKKELRQTWILRVLAKARPDLTTDPLEKEADNSIKAQMASGDMTPATMAVAFGFIMLVIYFVTDTFFTASEFYAEDAPLAWFIGCGIAGSLLALFLLKQKEPDRKDSATYALLFGLGVGLASHPFIARVNTWTDDSGLKSYEYLLGNDLVWRENTSVAPDLHLYLSSSEWWRQYKPGDTYTYELRKGGLGLWQVNMAPIYEAQKSYYKNK